MLNHYKKKTIWSW